MCYRIGPAKTDYIGTRAQDDDYYDKLTTDYLTLKGSASRAKINKLLMDKLRPNGRIRNTGSRGHPVWLLAE